MWLSVSVAVLGAMGNNIGKALQKRSVGGLPRLRLERVVLKQYLLNRTYTTGLALDITGALLNVVALANAPVSVIQPLMSSGLALLAVFSHFYLDERLQQNEWIAVGLAGVGIVGLGISSEEEPEDVQIHPFRILLCFGLCVSFLVAGTLVLQRKGQRPRASCYSPGAGNHLRDLNLEELLAGAQSGICFGLSASTCRTGFLLARVTKVWLLGVVGLGMSVALTSTGLLIQTEGLKDGRSVVVCTCTEAALMATALIYGMYALGESLPETQGLRLLRYCSWVLIIVGITSLSRASHGAKGSGGSGKGIVFGKDSLHRVGRPQPVLPFVYSRPTKAMHDI